MPRILAIDYGQKRTGIAVTDPSQIISTGLTTVDTNTLFAYLTDYLKKEPVEEIIVGHPKHLNNTDSDSMKFIEPFYRKLSELFTQIPITLFDERYTSKMAFQAMIDGGLKQKDRRNKALIDQVSATILLQNYMEFKKNTKR